CSLQLVGDRWIQECQQSLHASAGSRHLESDCSSNNSDNSLLGKQSSRCNRKHRQHWSAGATSLLHRSRIAIFQNGEGTARFFLHTHCRAEGNGPFLEGCTRSHLAWPLAQHTAAGNKEKKCEAG